MMRAQKALCCCLVVLALVNGGFCQSGQRQLRVVDGKNAKPADSVTTASVGQDLVIDSAPKKASAAALDEAAQQLPLGRRGGAPEQRQAAVTDPLPATIADPLLPFCRPGNGVICSDRDYTALLKVQPANIDLTADNFAFGSVNPSVQGSLAGDTKIDLFTRSYSTAGKVNGQGDLKSNIGTEVVNANTDTTNTVAGTTVKGRLDLVQPEKVSVAIDKTDSVNTAEWRSNKPNYYYILGQNFGLPNGFALAKDGIFGKKR